MRSGRWAPNLRNIDSFFNLTRPYFVTSDFNLIFKNTKSTESIDYCIEYAPLF